MLFELRSFENGKISIFDVESGETMHSLIGPWEEAHQVYITPSRLEKKLFEQKDPCFPLVLYDVGFGIAANALAAVETLERLGTPRSLHIVSFENQLQPIHIALEQTGKFPFLNRWKNLLHELLSKRKIEWQSPVGSLLKWDLLCGDFRNTLHEASPADLIFYDFFSPKACPDLWGIEAFRLITGHQNGKAFSLYTYSSSTAARTAMLIAGLYVGYGVSTLGKKETTVASTILSELEKPLDQRWLDHWHRSSKPLPKNTTKEDLQIFKQKMGEQISQELSGI